MLCACARTEAELMLRWPRRSRPGTLAEKSCVGGRRPLHESARAVAHAHRLLTRVATGVVDVESFPWLVVLARWSCIGWSGGVCAKTMRLKSSGVHNPRLASSADATAGE